MTHESKVRKAIKRMGEKYACHKANQVKRLETPLADSVGTDIRRTFERIQAEQSQPANVTRIIKVRA